MYMCMYVYITIIIISYYCTLKSSTSCIKMGKEQVDRQTNRAKETHKPFECLLMMYLENQEFSV